MVIEIWNNCGLEWRTSLLLLLLLPKTRWDSSVGIVTEMEALWWKSPSSIPGKGRDFHFSQTSTLALEHTQSSTVMYRRIFLCVLNQFDVKLQIYVHQILWWEVWTYSATPYTPQLLDREHLIFYFSVTVSVLATTRDRPTNSDFHYTYIYNWFTTSPTGLFISPSGISELDCATTKTDTAERSISTERDIPSFCPNLQVLDMCTLGDAPDVNPVIKFLRHALQHLAVDSSDCLHDPLSQLW